MSESEPSATGRTWRRADDGDDALRALVEVAFDYRGDVTIQRDDGESVVGFLYDRSVNPSLADSKIRILPSSGAPRLTLSLDRVTELAITGKDTAAGKSWEAWVRRYAESRAGENPPVASDLPTSES